MGVTVEKYCQVVERDSSTISILWKAAHMLCLLTVIVCSVLTAIDMIIVVDTFGHGCVLFANLSFSGEHTYETVGMLPENLSFHNSETIWGTELKCAYAKCTYLLSMIVAMLMLAFIIILPKGGYARDRTVFNEGWTFAPWGIIISFIMIIFVGIAYYILNAGIRVFTDQLFAQLHKTGTCRTTEDCSKFINIFTLVYHATEVKISRHLLSLMVSSLATIIAWSVLMASLILRMLLGVDFRIIVYTIRPSLKDDSASSLSSASIMADHPLLAPSQKLQDAQIPGKRLSKRDEEENISDFELVLAQLVSDTEFANNKESHMESTDFHNI